MPLNFPSNPSLNQQSTQNNRTYQWTGSAWEIVGSGLSLVSSQITDFNSSVSGLLPTIANSGDNRVLTSTGSTVGINAESNLTFNGNLLNVTGSGNFSSGLVISNQTASTIASFDSNKNVVSLSTATYPSLTELSYVKGVTSAIQTQIDSKAATSTTVTAGSGLAGGGSLAANRTIDVGQGDGISVSADSIAVDSTVVRTTGVQTISGAKTFTAATVFSTGVTISSSGTNVPLTITNDGTGNSFVVNDVTGDTSPFVINNDGRIGIGYSTPDYPMHIVVGASGTNNILSYWNNTNNTKSRMAFQDTSTTYALDLGSVGNNFTIETVGVERFRIDGSGNIDFRLNSGSISHRFTYNENGGEIILHDDAQGNATLIDQCSNQTRILELINGSDMVIGLGGSNTTGAIKFMRAGFSEAMRIASNGDTQIGGTNVVGLRYFDVRNTDSTLNSGSIIRLITRNAANTGDTSTDLLRYNNGLFAIVNNDSGPITLNTGGQERVRIDSSGNIGIGTTSPSHKLDVNGEIRLRGTGASSESGKFHLYYVSSTNRATWTTDSSGNAYLETGSSSPAARFWVNVNGRVGLTPNNEKYGLQLNKSSTLNGPFIGSDGADIFCVSTAGGGELFRIQADGKTGIGTSSPPEKLSVFGDTNAGRTSILIDNLDQRLKMSCYYESGVGQYAEIQAFDNAETGYHNLLLNRQGGTVLIATTSTDPAGANGSGTAIKDYISVSRSGGISLYLNRKTNDGDIAGFYQDGVLEGSISVAGNTVSYNAFLGSHWSQLIDQSINIILKGTVMETIDDFCVWDDIEHDRLVKVKISDTIQSKRVYGVFSAWDKAYSETGDMYIASLGVHVVRINKDVIVNGGDLLESAGDGTANIQSDDIIKSSTIGKVLNNKKIITYDDGSYLVSCALMCG